MLRIVSAVLAFSGFIFMPLGEALSSSERSPYAGQEVREIKSLSQSDIDALRSGRGWGFAKPAELNSYPGPAHVIELADALQLSTDQRKRIDGVFRSMEAQAKVSGARFLEVEKSLEAAFATRKITKDLLNELTSQAAQVRGELRRVHLAAHIAVRGILTDKQVARYDELRGYQKVRAPESARGSTHDHK